MVKSATACGRFENLPNITAKQTTDNKKSCNTIDLLSLKSLLTLKTLLPNRTANPPIKKNKDER